MQTNRRALLGTVAAAVAPVLLTSAPAAAITADPTWTALVADLRAKRVAWEATIGLEDELRFGDLAAALAKLPPEPRQPGSSLPVDFDHLTFAQIKASTETPKHKAAWAAYERDHAAWKVEHDAVEERILTPAQDCYRAALDAYSDALDAVIEHPVSSLRHLAEKIEIIAADREGAEVPMDSLGRVLADVRRLGGEVL